ncbi:MAG: 50S ribosomal protein L11 methyltransferase [Deltaproteobacteria bacterium]|nr:50S ribosomal protein L11 methyltransferase [Deltaproteobacteria bacterium]
MMTCAESSWWALVCTPVAEASARERLEEFFFEYECRGLWEGVEGLVEKVEEPLPPPGFPAFLTAYFTDVADGVLRELVRRLHQEKLITGEARINAVENQDWFENWRKNFVPVALTAKTLVVPAWQEEVSENETCRVVRIYPGQGFGTGTHETTRLAALNLERELEKTGPSATVLDVGTGSGILAIMAAVQGAARVLALDVDPDALDNARENCVHNRIEDLVELDCRPLAEVEGSFTLIVANIIAPVLKGLLPQFHRLLVSSGRLILSGILLEQIDEMKEHCERRGFKVELVETAGEWAAFVCARQ